MRKSKWLSSLTSALMMMLNTTSKSVVTYWVSAHKLTTPTIRRPYSIIYFRKSSSTRVPPPLEAPKVDRKSTQIWLMLLETIEEHKIKPVLWTKGQMLIQEWAVTALRILLWPTLICKMVPVMTKTLMVPMLSSNNCIEYKLYLYKSYKSRLKISRRYYYMCLLYPWIFVDQK